MKISAFLMFCCVSAVFAGNIKAQEAVVNVQFQSLPLSQLIEQIEAQTSYMLVYKNDDLDTNQTVALHETTGKVKDLLADALEESGIGYSFDNNYIILHKAEDVVKPASTLQSGINLKGVVTDAAGEPVIGASIRVKGTTTGTTTDMNGQYTLNVPAGATIEISYIGYVTQEIAVGNRTNINIQLVEENQLLEEVVVVGYGTVKKSDLTGSVASVKSDDLTKMATESPISALQGRVAGVSIVLNSGAPDAGSSIKIRGVGTTNNSSPLFVVDGFPMSDIDYLSPTDIESIEILKDASASAIYGSRGANGVVLVTTKKGQAGTLRVNIRAQYGIDHLAMTPEMLNSDQYATLSNAAYANAGQTPPYTTTTGLPTTNWFDEVSQTGQVQNYNISLSGGTKNVTTMVSFNMYDRKGVIKSTDFRRYSVTANNTLTVNKYLSFRTSLSASFRDFKRMDQTSIFLSSLIAPPTDPVWDDQTNYYTGITKMRLANPVGALARNNGKNRGYYLIGNANMEVKPVKNVTFNSMFGLRYDGTYNSGFTPIFYETSNISELTNTVTRSTSRNIDWTWENILTYHAVFKKIHDLTVMGAISARSLSRDSFNASKQNLPVATPNYWFFDSATDNPQAGGEGSALSMLSYLGRVNYNLMNRYLLTFSVRRDGSSRFLPDKRWGTFPSAALAWRITEEPFFKKLNLSQISNLKLRLGYGELGNENINSYYPYLTPVSQRNYYTLGASQVRVNGSGLSGIGNADAQWETSSQTNIGLDLGILDGRLSVVADYFLRQTDNILLSQQIPAVSGSGSIIRNVGGMKNSGIEFSATWQDRKGDLSYSINANASIIKNEVTNLGTASELTSSFAYDYVLIDLQGQFGNMMRSVVGKPYRQFWGYQADGIFQTDQEVAAYVNKDGQPIMPDAKAGDMKFKDLDNNGRITTADMTFIGNPFPDVTYGISFDGKYKNFDLNVLFQGVQGNDVYNAAKFYFMKFDGRNNVRTEYMDKYWHGQGTSNTYPIITSDLTRNQLNYRNSDFYIEDGSYLRLKTIQLGYNIKVKLAPEFSPSIRLYVSAQNLLTLTKYSGFEPELSDISVDRGQYPQSRSFLFGTIINF